MRTKGTTKGGQSNHANNEQRDSNGRFTTKGNNSRSGQNRDKRGDNAKNEKRDSQGRFESK